MNTKLLLVLAGVAAFNLAACEEKKDPATGMNNNAATSTKEAAARGTEAVKDAAAKGTEAVKDAAAKGKEDVKDAAANTGNMADRPAGTTNNAWEATRNKYGTDSSPVFKGFTTQVADLTKRVDDLPAAVKDPAKTVLKEVTTKIAEGEALLNSLKTADATTWKGISDKVEVIIPQIKDGLARVTAMLPR